MSAHGQDHRPPGDIIRERCAAAGHLAWRVDTQGRVQQEPMTSEAAGLFLHSSSFWSLVEERVTGWESSGGFQEVELWPGCSLLGLPTLHRGRITGYILVVLFEPSALQESEFESLCQRAMLDADATRQSMGPYAVSSPSEASRLLTLLRPMHEDLERSALDSRTIDGFTNHLGDAYEQMSLMHELGRSMTRFARPIEFFNTVLERLADTLQYRWLCVLIGEDADLPPDVSGQSFGFGMGRVSADQLRGPVWARVLQSPESEASTVSTLQALGIALGGQVVLQPILDEGRIGAVLVAGGKRGDDPQVSSYDTKLITSIAGFIGTFLENTRLEVRRNAMFVGSIQALTALVDAKDHYTLGHSERVALLGAQLGIAIGLGAEVVERIHLCGLLHDIGKVGVPEAVLTKTSRLTDEEFEIIKRHPRHGYNMLMAIPGFEDILGGILTHHERWDGRGYPDGVSGEDIPLFGRILCLADSFDAMSSNRAYRPAMPREKVLSEVINCAGGQFDPNLAPVFAAMDFTAFDDMLADNAQRSTQFKAA